MKLTARTSRGAPRPLESDRLPTALQIPMLEGFLETLTGQPVVLEACPVCGCRDEDYQATGYVGCGACYETLPSLRR